MKAGELLPLILLLGAGYLLIIRPMQRQKAARAALAAALAPGAEVITTSGLHGTVVSLDGDDVVLEVADGIRLTYLRAAIGAVKDQANEAARSDAEPNDPDDPSTT